MWSNLCETCVAESGLFEVATCVVVECDQVSVRLVLWPSVVKSL